LLHEFAVHAQPFYNVFKKIRQGEGPKDKESGEKSGGSAFEGHHHDNMALGKNEFYEDMYAKVLTHIRQLEVTKKDTQGVHTAGLVDQHDIDQYTQMLQLIRKVIKNANDETGVSSAALQKNPSPETYLLFHNSLKKHVEIMAPIKDKLNGRAMMFELWPELVKVFSKEEQYIGSEKMYLKLLPLITKLQKSINDNYNFINKAYQTTTKRIQSEGK